MVGWIQFHLLRIFKCLDQRNDISVTEFLENLDLSEQSEIVVVVGEREVGQNDLTKVTNRICTEQKHPCSAFCTISTKKYRCIKYIQ